jgi:hypothetical protein
MKSKLWFVIVLIIGFSTSEFYAQPHFTCTLMNDTLAAPNVYEFDIYMLSNDTATIELAGINIGFTYNTDVQDTGKFTLSWVPKSSELTNPAQLPKIFRTAIGKKDSTEEVGVIIIGPRLPVGTGNGSIISNKGMGTRIGRFRIANSINFMPARMNIEWNILKKNGIYPTTINAYIKNYNTNIMQSGTFLSKLENPVLK